MAFWVQESEQSENRAGHVLSSFFLWGIASVLFVAMTLLAEPQLRLALGLSGAIVVLVNVGLWLRRGLRRRARKSLQRTMETMVRHGPNQQFLCDETGRILASNSENAAQPEEISGVLGRLTAEADGICARLVAEVQDHGGATYDHVLREGRLRVHVTRLAPGFIQWQIDHEFAEDKQRETVGVPRIPLLTVGRSNAILFMNAAAREFLGERKTRLGDVFCAGIPRAGEANAILTAAGLQQCLVAEFPLSCGRRELYLLPMAVSSFEHGAIKFDDLPVALLKVDVGGRVLLANRAAEALVKKPLNESANISDLMEGLGRSINDWLAEAAAGHGETHSEFLLLKRDDREVFVQVSLNRIVEGDQTSLIAVLSDATELKSLEAQFVQSQKMQAIGQLAGGVAHDFNNLLTAITGHCDLLLLRHDQGDPDFGDLVQINQNANRAASLVGQLLAFSRKQNLQPKVLDLRNTLADLTHLLNRLVGEKISLNLIHDPVLRSIRADKRQLEQVLMNLVVNARDAMPEGGEITIRTESLLLKTPLERDNVTVPAGKYVGMKVCDQGVGIPPDKLQKVFEPFFTTKRTGEGTGLGLSTAYGIVKQTGGYVFVDSIPGQGTTFSLLFPAHDLYESPVTPAEPEEKIASAMEERGGVVLLVEDEAPVRSFASRALRLNGFTVLEAASGEEALEILKDADLRVDLFVSDVIMPGLDGPGWISLARETRPGIPVIFMSGYAEDSFPDKQAAIEGSVFLPKPFSLKDLTKTVQRHMGAA